MENIVYKEWAKVIDIFRGYHADDRVVEAWKIQRTMRHEYAWAIPDDFALDIIVSHSPIVEIGAGKGYWAALLAERGADIICYDEKPYENNWMVGPNRFFDVVLGGPTKANRHPNRTLFLCWPPYSTSMAADALRAYQGKTVIYIGEGDGGCTGDDNFHALLNRWNKITDYSIPTWYGLHDYLSVYRRI